MDNTPLSSIGVSEIIHLANLEEQLPPNAGLLMYYKCGPRWLALVVTKNKRQSCWLAVEPGGAQSVTQLTREFIGMTSDKNKSLAEIIARADTLHALFWEPLQTLIDGLDLLYVVPHGILHSLPFGALHDEKGWLVNSGPALAYEPSASILFHTLSGMLPQKPRFIGFANQYGPVGPTTTRVSFLPNVVTEIKDASRHYQQAKIEITQTRENSCTRSAFFSMAPEADILHIACHGRLSRDSSKSGFLLLTTNGEGDWITTRDIQQARLNTRLVIASICHGSAGRLAEGDEWLGLLRAFFVSGVHGVVAARWELNDKVALLLMASLHRNLSNRGTAEAIRDSARELINGADFNHPYYWASLGVWGNGGYICA
jgi:CHAT domain-containing protein